MATQFLSYQFGLNPVYAMPPKDGGALLGGGTGGASSSALVPTREQDPHLVPARSWYNVGASIKPMMDPRRDLRLFNTAFNSHNLKYKIDLGAIDFSTFDFSSFLKKYSVSIAPIPGGGFNARLMLRGSSTPLVPGKKEGRPSFVAQRERESIDLNSLLRRYHFSVSSLSGTGYCMQFIPRERSILPALCHAGAFAVDGGEYYDSDQASNRYGGRVGGASSAVFTATQKQEALVASINELEETLKRNEQIINREIQALFKKRIEDKIIKKSRPFVADLAIRMPFRLISGAQLYLYGNLRTPVSSEERMYSFSERKEKEVGKRALWGITCNVLEGGKCKSRKFERKDILVTDQFEFEVFRFRNELEQHRQDKWFIVKSLKEVLGFKLLSDQKYRQHLDKINIKEQECYSILEQLSGLKSKVEGIQKDAGVGVSVRLMPTLEMSVAPVAVKAEGRTWLMSQHQKEPMRALMSPKSDGDLRDDALALAVDGRERYDFGRAAYRSGGGTSANVRWSLSDAAISRRIPKVDENLKRFQQRLQPLFSEWLKLSLDEKINNARRPFLSRIASSMPFLAQSADDSHACAYFSHEYRGISQLKKGVNTIQFNGVHARHDSKTIIYNGRELDFNKEFIPNAGVTFYFHEIDQCQRIEDLGPLVIRMFEKFKAKSSDCVNEIGAIKGIKKSILGEIAQIHKVILGYKIHSACKQVQRDLWELDERKKGIALSDDHVDLLNLVLLDWAFRTSFLII